MSSRAMQWAKKQKVGNMTSKFALTLLAELVDDDGHWEKAGQKYLATMMESSTRTVSRALADLEEKGFISRVARYKGKDHRLPDALQLNLDSNTGQSVSTPPDNLSSKPLTNSPLKRVTKDITHTNEQPPLLDVPAEPPTSSTSEEEFDQFWEKYPRKEAKADARKAFKSARKTTSFDVIMAGLLAYAAAKAGEEQRFIKTPGPWLRGERWADEVPKQTDPWSHLRSVRDMMAEEAENGYLA